MIKRKNRIKALIAGLLSAFMVLGAVAVAPVEVQANPFPAPSVWIDGNILRLTTVPGGLPHNARLGFQNPVHLTILHGFLVSDVVATGVDLVSAGFSPGATFHPIFLDGNFDPISPVGTSVTWHGQAGGQLAAPTNVHVDASNVLRWNVVPNAEYYQITGTGIGFSWTFTDWTTGNAANFLNLQHHIQTLHPGQTVEFSVSARTTATGFTNSPTITVPWTVPGNAHLTPVISISPAGILTWTGGASHLVGVYRNGTRVHTTTTAVTQIDLTTLTLPTGQGSIQLRFLASGGLQQSALSTGVNFTSGGTALAAPTNVRVSGTTLNWNAVPNATGYRVYVGGTARTTGTAITGTEFNLATLNLPAGNHNVQVRALGNNTTTLNSALSTGVNFTPGAVATPTNVRVVGSVLNWNAVSNAEGYRVYVNGTARTTGTAITGTSFDLATLDLAIGTYQVQVRALGNNTTTQNSGLSTAVEFVMQVITLPAPTGVNLQGTILHWSAVPNVRAYVIYVNGAVATPTMLTTSFNLLGIVLPAGSQNNIQVRALGNGTTTLDSALSATVVFTAPAAQPTPTPTPTPTPLPGEQPSYWAQSYVTRAVGAGLVPAHLQLRFTQATTRAEFAALAVALYETVQGYEIMGRMPFNDTQDVNVQKMGYMRVVGGIGGGYFAPNRTLSREEAAAMISRLADALERPLPTQSAAFNDNAAISSWAVGYVGQMQITGIMGGLPGNRFDPAGAYTREQSIITMMRLYDVVGGSAVAQAPQATPAPTPAPTPEPTPQATPAPTPTPAQEWQGVVETTRSAIILPNRQLTQAERDAWIAEYNAMGGPNAFEVEVVRIINEIRAEHGLTQLQMDSRLMMAARFYTQTKVDLGLPLGHQVGPYGGSGNTAQAFGATWNTANGGTGGGGMTPQGQVNAWMNSDGHRRNILNVSSRSIGIGSTNGTGGTGGFNYMLTSTQQAQQ